MTIRHALDDGLATLEKSNVAGARLDTELLMSNVLGKNRAWLIAHDQDDVSLEDLDKFQALINKRSQHIPVVHLTGSREFYGLDFEITPDVLTPRVETEQIVEWAIKYAPKNSEIIDIGTGSGAIAVAIATNRPDLKMTATEVTSEALNIARRNAKLHNTSITFIKSDIWNQVTGRYDMVVTNLPYLKDESHDELMPEVRREPDIALFGGKDGLDLYRRLLKDIDKHLVPGGYLFTEADPWQHEELIKIARGASLEAIEQGYFIMGFKLSS